MYDASIWLVVGSVDPGPLVVCQECSLDCCTVLNGFYIVMSLFIKLQGLATSIGVNQAIDIGTLVSL
jgi:hypothetical protein